MAKKIIFKNNKVLKEAIRIKGRPTMFKILVKGELIEVSEGLLNTAILEMLHTTKVLNSIYFSDMIHEMSGESQNNERFYSEELIKEVELVISKHPKNFSLEDVSKVLGMSYMEAKSAAKRWIYLDLIVEGLSERFFTWRIKSVTDLSEPEIVEIEGEAA